jgi:hypothetical protein
MFLHEPLQKKAIDPTQSTRVLKRRPINCNEKPNSNTGWLFGLVLSTWVVATSAGAADKIIYFISGPAAVSFIVAQPEIDGL